MKDFVIITDSCCDLDFGMRKNLGVEYIKMVITSEGKESLIDLDWTNFSPKEFYDFMRKGQRFKTTQVNMEDYIEKFEPYLKKDIDILSLVTSSGLSGSINSCNLAKEELLKRYPDAVIYAIDTLRGSLGQGLICFYAAKLKKEGKSIKEIADWIENNKLNIHQVGSVDDLSYLKRAGRVTGMAAFMGGLLKIKPIIISNAKGQNATISKVKGRKNSVRECFKYMQENIINPESQTIFLVHADCAETELEEIKKEIYETFKCKDIYVNYVGPVIGSVVGPGMFGIYFYGKKVEIAAEK